MDFGFNVVARAPRSKGGSPGSEVETVWFQKAAEQPKGMKVPEEDNHRGGWHMDLPCPQRWTSLLRKQRQRMELRLSSKLKTKKHINTTMNNIVSDPRQERWEGCLCRCMHGVGVGWGSMGFGISFVWWQELVVERMVRRFLMQECIRICAEGVERVLKLRQQWSQCEKLESDWACACSKKVEW